MNLQKTYLSRSMTRAMALDHPIGDPFGGAAYGERRDPVSAIVAVASMAMSAEGAALLVAGTINLGTVAAGLAFAGGAMSLVGNATGNKDLMKIGTIASVAGGVGGLLDSAGFLGQVAKDGSALAATGGGTTEAMQGGFGATEAAAGADVGAAAQGAQAGAAPSVSDSIVGSANPNVTVNSLTTDAIAAPAPLADASTSSLVSQAPVADAGTSQAMQGGFGSAAGSEATYLGGSGTTEAMQGGFGQGGLIQENSAVITPQASTGGGQMMIDDQGGRYFMPDGGGVQPGSVQPAPDSAFGSAGEAGRPATWLDKAKDMMPDTSKMSTMDKFLAMKVGSDVVGGVMGYIAPSAQAKAQTNAMNAQADAASASAEKARADVAAGTAQAQSEAARAAAAANQAQADKIKADEKLRQDRLAALNRNMGMGIDMGSVNPNAVKISGPALRTSPGLINGARATA